MTTNMQELEAVRRRRVRVRALAVAAVVAGIGAWAALPFGIVLLTRGEVGGWALVATGAVLLVACVLAIVGAVRSHAAPQSRPGRADPAFDEPSPSENPNGGYSSAGMQLGSF